MDFGDGCDRCELGSKLVSTYGYAEDRGCALARRTVKRPVKCTACPLSNDYCPRYERAFGMPMEHGGHAKMRKESLQSLKG